jgi:hypothetical protein
MPIFEQRHLAVRIQRQVPVFVVLAVLEPRVEALVRDAELADTPHDLLHIDRARAAPDSQHRIG